MMFSSEFWKNRGGGRRDLMDLQRYPYRGWREKLVGKTIYTKQKPGWYFVVVNFDETDGQMGIQWYQGEPPEGALCAEEHLTFDIMPLIGGSN